jgi:hypothetical protein
MSKDLIRYDLLAQEALRDVVRKVLADVGKTGLPGDHHFYIAFSTDYPGVRLSQRLREQYPGEMTIVLQHQFWDLGVTEHTFEVGLSFGGVPERLLVPFEAITQFFDPSANFGLKFEVVEPAGTAAPAPSPATPPRPATPIGTASEKIPRKAAPKGAGSEPSTVPAATPASVPLVKPAAEKSSGKRNEASRAEEPAPSETAEPARGAEVVSLDKFRKK